MNLLKKYAPFLAILAMALVFSDASAQIAGLDTAATGICKSLKAIQGSTIIKVVAVAMFFAGAIMIWLKQRGGVGMAVTGLLGFFIIPNATTIANNLGMTACTG